VDRDGPRLNAGAPSDVLAAYGLNPVPGIGPDSYPDYGAEHAVTAMDMRPMIRGRARRNPLVLMGCWSNMAEIAVGTGYGSYDVHNVEDRVSFIARMTSGALDRLNSARFLRMLTENIKRSMGVLDTIAFPRDNAANKPYWPSLVGAPSAPEGATMHWLTSTMITRNVKWSWTVNVEVPAGGSTLTGCRTVSGMWRTFSITEWGSISMKCIGYEMDTTEQRWSNNLWLQLGQGEDAPLCESVMSRLNLQAKDWQLTYKSHPAPSWAHTLDLIPDNAKLLSKTQRKVLLRCTCAYRTVAGGVANVLASIPPADLLAREREFYGGVEGQMPYPRKSSGETPCLIGKLDGMLLLQLTPETGRGDSSPTCPHGVQEISASLTST